MYPKRRFIRRDQRSRRRLNGFQSLEPRQLLSADWQNPARPHDVNNDGVSNPLDALVILNRLSQVDTPTLSARTNRLDRYYDVSGDNLITAFDSLLVLNEISRSGNGYLNDFLRIDERSEIAPSGFLSMPWTVLPGDADQVIDIQSSLTIGREEFNEFGIFIADDSVGNVKGVHPSSPEYPMAVFGSTHRTVLYSKQAAFRSQKAVTLPAGSSAHLYVLQGTTSNGDASSHILVEALGDSNYRVRWEEHAPLLGFLGPIAPRHFDDATIGLRYGDPYIANQPPILLAIGDQTIEELSTFRLQVAAEDPDLPDETLTYELVSGPEGAVLDARSGMLTWLPSEGQGPGTYSIVVRVTDLMSASDVESFVIQVLEVNRPPELEPIADRNVRMGDLVTLQTVAVDQDLPAGRLTFSLDATAPFGASIDPSNGLFTWQTPDVDIATEFPITIRATDDGNPSLSASRSFVITVNPMPNCGFDTQLSGWTRFESGGTPAGRGQAKPSRCTVTITEGDSFVVGLARSVIIPAGSAKLRFGFELPSFDNSDRNFIKDAFEVALTDREGIPLIGPFSSGRDAFINFTEEMPPAISEKVMLEGGMVTVDLTGVAAGTEATLILRLVNNDTDRRTSVKINSWELLPEVLPLVSAIAETDGQTNLIRQAGMSVGKDLEGRVTDLQGATFGGNGLYSPSLSGTRDDERVLSQTADRLESRTAGTPLLTLFQEDRQKPYPAGPFLISGQAVGRDALPENEVVLVTVNGVAVDQIDAVGNFFAAVNLRPGLNRFEVIASDRAGRSSSLSFDVNSFDAMGSMAFDRSTLDDVTDSFQGVYFRTAFNDQSGMLFVDLAATNRGQLPFNPPLLVGVKNLSEPSIRLVNSDGTLPDGTAFYDYSDLLAEGGLVPGQSTASPTIGFRNVERTRFDYELVFFARQNQVPFFTTAPQVEATVGADYRYLSAAVDPDGDAVEYSLILRPQGMTIDPTSGVITWRSSDIQPGNHQMLVRATDRHGATAEQRFTVRAIEPTPNRPPLIESFPVTAARLVSPSRDEALGQVLSATIRDFTNSHPDFAAIGSGLVSALVAGELSADGKPIFVGPPGRGSITSGLTFDQWFRDVPGVNRSKETDWSLTKTVPGGKEYHFTSDAFFPIDNELLAQENGSRNALFTFEAGADFIYRGDELLSVTSDDDAWVFIDGRLVIDLGGMHELTTEQLDLDELGLVVGQPYDFRIFYAERDGSESSFSFATTIDFLSASAYRYPIRATDPDRDPLSFELVSAPRGMTVNGSNGIVFWEPDVNQIGDHLVVARVEDGRGGFAEQRYTVTVTPDPTNRPPSIVSQPALTRITANQIFEYRYDVDAIDPDGDTLSYELTEGPPGMSIDPITGMIRWAPSSASNFYPASVRVSDGYGGSAEQSWTIEVLTTGSEIRGTKFDDLNSNGIRDQGLVIGTEPDVVYIIDISGSTSARFLGSSVGDLNRDGNPNQILDAEIAGFIELNRDLVRKGYGDVADVTVISFNSSDYVLDLDPVTPNVQMTTKAGADRNANGVPDVEEALRGLQHGGGTNFVRAIRRASAILRGLGTTPQNGNVIFLSDGYPDYSEAHRADVRELRALAENVRAFGVGGGASLRDLLIIDNEAAIFKTTEELLAAFQGIGSGPNAPPSYTEPGLPGVSVFIDANNNGIRDKDEQSTVTDASGKYAFTGLPAGSYVIREEPLTGYRQTYPNAKSEVGGNIHYVDWRSADLNAGVVSGEINLPDGTTIGVTFEALRGDGTPGEIYFAQTDESGVDYWSPSDAFISKDVPRRPPGTDIIALVGGAGRSYRVKLSEPAFEPLVSIVSLGQPGLTASYQFDVPFQIISQGAGRFGGDGTTLSVRPANILAGREGNGTIKFPGVHKQIGWTIPDPESWHGITFGIRTSAVAPQDVFHRVALNPGQVVDDADFGNHRLTVIPPNRHPVLSVNAPSIATVGKTYTHLPLVNDADGDRLLFDLPVGPGDMAINPLSGAIVWTPDPDQVGQHDVTLRVRDGKGGLDLHSFRLAVVADGTAPLITSVPPEIATVGLPWRYQVVAQDAEGDSLVYSLKSSPSGMAIDATTGRIDWTPSAIHLPGQRIEIEVSDGSGDYSVQSFDLLVTDSATNRPPTLRQMPAQRVLLGSEFVLQLFASDPDGDPVSYSLLSGPPEMTIAANGFVRWSPATIPPTPPEVTIRADDGRGGFSTQTFILSVEAEAGNLPPRFTSLPPTTGSANAPYVYDIRGDDPDGDQIIWNIERGPQGMSIDGVNGRIRWVPTNEQVGVTNVEVRAFDSQGGSAVQSFTIAVAANNTAPLVLSSPTTLAYVGQYYTYAVRANDREGDRILFTLDVAPEGMSIDATTGLIGWVPSPVSVGSAEVAVRVTDARGAATVQSFRIETRLADFNRAPSITSIPPLSTVIGANYRYEVTATDPDLETVTFELLQGPVGMTIDRSRGVIGWSPMAGQAGDVPITVAAKDAKGATAFQSFSLSVLAENRPPVISGSPPRTAMSHAIYRYDVQASDPDRDILAMRLVDSPFGMTINGITGQIRWKPTASQVGVADVAIEVTDARGGMALQRFSISVMPDDEAPKIALNIRSGPIPRNESFQIRITATDNVEITERRLFVNGQSVPISPQGIAFVVATDVGPLRVTASVTDAAGNTTEENRTLDVFDPSVTGVPQAEILSPAPDPSTGAMPYVTGPIDIYGTVDDPDLAFYRLDLLSPQGQFIREIAKGTTNVSNGFLGRLDPTILLNDSYLIRLTAQDLGLNRTTVDRPISVGGSTKLGNFTLSFTDLTVPVSGVPIILGRTYDTLLASHSDDFGFGWRMDFRDADLRTSVPAPTELERELGLYSGFSSGTRVFVTVPGGKREGFTFRPQPAPGLAGTYLRMWEPRFVADPGVQSVLSVNRTPLLALPNGSFVGFGGGGQYNPANPIFGGGNYRLTTRDGIVYSIDGDSGDIEKMTDRNGNEITFSEDAIRSASGPEIRLERDGRGRIITVTDPAGEKIRYGYDSRGNLTSVTDRLGNVTRFEYLNDPAHYLSKVIDPLGREGIRNEYGADGRLRRVLDAKGNAIELAFDSTRSVYTETDPLGNATTFEFDDRGNAITEIDAAGGVVRMSYDANNNMLSRTDQLGNTTLFTYDKNGNQLTMTDPMGRTTRFSYDVKNELTNGVDPLGNTTASEYDAVGNLTSIVGLPGGPNRFSYDRRGNLKSLGDGAGITSFEHDSSGRVIRQIDPLGHTTTFAYDASGREISRSSIRATTTGVRTLVTRTEYDAEGRVIREVDAEGGTVTYQYDAGGQRIAMTTERGFVTRFVYDSVGQVIETIYPDLTPIDETDNPRTRTEYDAAGQVTAEIDELGRRTEYRYDRLGRRIMTIFPDDTPDDTGDNPVTRSEYDSAGRVTATIDERGFATKYQYDTTGRLVLTILPDETPDLLADNPRISEQYDEAGRRIATTDPLGRVTKFIIDPLGRITETLYPDNEKVITAFNTVGQVVARTDQEGNTTRFEYDASRRLTAVINAMGKRTEYQYDEAGNLISQRDANGRVTRHEYDGLNRRISTQLPMGQRSSTAYDAKGNAIRTTDFNGDTLIFEYDPRDRMTVKEYPNSSKLLYQYDAVGQRTAVVDSRGTTTYRYDARKRLVSRTDPDGSLISYRYDLAGNRIRMETGSMQTLYGFDAQNRLTELFDSQIGTTLYRYDLAGNLLATLRSSSNTTQTRSYDVMGRLTLVENSGPDGLIDRFEYTLDRTGARVRTRESHGIETRELTYAYDEIYRLIGETTDDDVLGDRTISYAYDAVGNRIRRDDSITGTTLYSYDDNDRLLSESRTGESTQYRYDNNGNTLSRITAPTDQVFFAWDYDNRLAAADITDKAGTSAIKYRYDADGLRVERTVGDETARYLIDTIQRYPQVIKEYTPSGALIARFVYGNELIAEHRPGTTGPVIIHTDGLGSILTRTDADGAVIERFDYDAFGNVYGDQGNGQDMHLFAGQQRDSDLDLDYLRARFYDPTLGRFVSRDPLAGAIGNPLNLHRYIYGNADPVNNTDPTGLFSLSALSAGLHASATLGEAFSTIYLPVALKGGNLAIAIYLMQPGFAARNAGMDMIAAGAFEAGYEQYRRGGQIIAAAAGVSKEVQNLLDTGMLIKSTVKLFRTSVDETIRTYQVTLTSVSFRVAYSRFVVRTDSLMAMAESLTVSIRVSTTTLRHSIVVRDHSQRVYEGWNFAVEAFLYVWEKLHDD